MTLSLRTSVSTIVLLCALIYWTTAQPALTENFIDKDLLYREEYAKKIVSHMNLSVDPCDDFYEYACGNYKNSLEKVPSDKTYENFYDIEIDLFNLVENLIENPAESLKHKYADEINKARTLYQTCLRADLLPLPKSDVYLEVIENITGFPAIDANWKSDHFDWLNATAHLSVYGVESFVKEKYSRSYPFRPYFLLPDFGLDSKIRSEDIENKTSIAYKLNERRMRQYLTAYGVDEPKVSQVVSSVFELWHDILNVMNEFQNGEGYVNCTTTEHTGSKKFNKWQNYLQIVWNSTVVDAFKQCPCENFYVKLDEICNERKAAVANYLALKFLYQMDAALDNIDEKKDFCNTKVVVSMRFLIDQLYMAQRSVEAEKQEVELIAKNIRDTLREDIQSSSWMDEQTRKQALLMVSAFNLRVDPFGLDENMAYFIGEIKNLHIHETSFERNNLEASKFQAYMLRYFNLNAKTVDEEIKTPTAWIGMLLQRSWFNFKKHSLIIRTGSLNPPVYHKSWPWSLKYGALGYIIGYEIFFDFEDTQYSNDEIWTGDAQLKYSRTWHCFHEKYNVYSHTIRMSDYVGLQEAFNAYQRHIQKLKNEKALKFEDSPKIEHMPGLEMTPEQLFYLGFTQSSCDGYNDIHFPGVITYGSFGKPRNADLLSNSKEFAQAYNCPVGSKMNPTENKCPLW